MLRTHYRQPIDWTLKGLERAARFGPLAPRRGDTNPRLGQIHSSTSFWSRFLDDLNAPLAAAAILIWPKRLLTITRRATGGGGGAMFASALQAPRLLR